VPTLHPNRLTAPQNMTIHPTDDVATRNVFTGSMADMFGRWVPEPWIDAVMESIKRSPELNFLFLTKFPKRMIDREVPNNVWLGATVDKQARVKAVEDAFAQVPAHTRWLSLEPLLEPLQFSRPDLFKWVVIGGASPSSQTPAWNPPFSWVVDLYRQFKRAGAAVYFKTNIGFDETLPREFPWQIE
jgi:protein gp37